ncbi:uncharacterized protein LOC144861366 [Branchiostoma floridae x Branchiostoma japonicum]
MASNLQRSTADFDKQFLTCPVCMLHFRDPRVLPCLHTFCRECLQEWATKQQPLECPTCRTQVSLPDQGVDGLRTNFYVNNLLDFAAVKEGVGQGVPCQVCERKEEGARSWCVQCAVLLCESCTNTHRRFPAMKGHQIVTQENLEASEGVPSSFQRKAFCPKHEDQVLTFYCEPCQTLVCVACTIVDHRSGDKHNPVEIGSIAEKKKQDLQKLMGKIDSREKLVRATLNDIEKEMSALPTSADAAIEQATVYFNQLMALLRDRKEEVVTEIGSRRLGVGKCLETQKEAIEFELVGLTSASEFCKQALEHGSDVHVIEAESQARQRVEELLTTSNDLSTFRPSQVVFSGGTAVAEFRDDLARAGCVHVRYTGKVDASKCLVQTKLVDESHDPDTPRAEPLPLKPGSVLDALVSKTRTEATKEKLVERKANGEGSADANTKSAALPLLADQFKKLSGGWDCDTCMVQNTAAASRCVACDTPKPGKQTKPTLSTTVPPASFGTDAGSQSNAAEGGDSGFKFGFTFVSSSSSTTASKQDSDTLDGLKKGTTDLAKAGQICVPKPATDQSAAERSLESEFGTKLKVNPFSAFSPGTQFGSANPSTAPSFGSTTGAKPPMFGTGEPSSGLTFGAPAAAPPSTGSAAATTSGFTSGTGSSSTAASTTPSPFSFGAGAPSVTTTAGTAPAPFVTPGGSARGIKFSVGQTAPPAATAAPRFGSLRSQPHPSNLRGRPSSKHTLRTSHHLGVRRSHFVWRSHKLWCTTSASSSGPVLTIGNKGSREGELFYPTDVAVDMEGNIAVLDCGNRRVQIFDVKTGQSLRCFPVDGVCSWGIDIDSNGQFVSSQSADRVGPFVRKDTQGIRVYSQQGNLTKALKPDCLRDPLGVAVLQDGRMVVADHKQKSCLLLQPDGSLIREIGKGQLQYPRFLAVDESRDLFFVTDGPAHKVFMFDLEGKLKFSFGKQGREEGELSGPTGITVDPAGNIIVVNRDNGRLQVFGPDGTYLRTVATVKGGTPQGIALTTDNHIAVACSYGHCIELYRYK